jgi:Spy/CpxP family protein refolding chaperone
MKKQIFGISLFLLLVLSLFPAVMAEEELTEETIVQDTMAEVSTMDQKIGAELRLLQLEKAITRNILGGNEVIAQVEEDGKDATELEALITEFEALKLEVQDLNPEDEGAVEAFVNIKQEAIEISKEFREIARGLLEQGDRLAIASKIKEMDKTELQQYNEQIRNKIHAQNAEIVSKTFDSLGIENDELLTKVENGEATHEEVRNEIRNAVQAMTPEEKRAAFTTLKESGVRKDVAVRAKIEKARLNINERKATRLDYLEKASERIQNPERKARVQSALEQRYGVIDSRIDAISNRLDRAKEIRQNISDRRTAGGASE